MIVGKPVRPRAGARGRVQQQRGPQPKLAVGSTPFSVSDFAAASNAAQAVVARKPPTLTRRTPSFTRSAVHLRADQDHVDGLGGDRRHDRLNVFGLGNAGRIKNLGAGVRIGLQPLGGRVDIAVADQEAFRAANKHDVRIDRILGSSRGLQAMDGGGEIIEGVTLAVLDRRPATPAYAARLTLAATLAASSAKPASKSALTGRSIAATRVRRLASVSSTVGSQVARAERKRQAVAGRGDSLEAKFSETPGFAGMGRVGEDEKIVVQLAESGASCGEVGHLLSPVR